MNFTYRESAVNKARSEYLHDGERVPIFNKVFIKSFNTMGFYISNTLRYPGDKVGGRDTSQYIYLKKAANGNSFVGNR